MVSKALPEKMILDQSPEGSERVTHAGIWGSHPLDNGNCKVWENCSGYKYGWAQQRSGSRKRLDEEFRRSKVYLLTCLAL